MPASSLPDFPANLLEFQRMFADETACLRYLEQVRWPQGFTCEACCHVGEPSRVAKRPRVLRCRRCGVETTTTAGTIMHKTRTSLHVWFWAAYLVATTTAGLSALEMMKKLGVARYETAFQILHKLRAGMVRPDRDKIGGEWPVELDVIYVGGKHKGGRQGLTKQTPVAIAVEIRTGEVADEVTGDVEEKRHAGRVRLQVLPSKGAAGLSAFVDESIKTGTLIISDAGREFTGVAKRDYHHEKVVMHGDSGKAAAWLPMVGIITGNLKAWIDGTHHGVRKQHLQGYLNEFMFRFNRRFWRAVSFRTLLGLGSAHEGPTYRAVYAGDGPQGPGQDGGT